MPTTEHGAIRTLVQRVLKFALTSGGGLALDFAVFAALTALGMRPGLANLISATCGVTFVYFVSIYSVFSYRGERLMALFVMYLSYQAVAVAAASWMVGALSNVAPPLLAKLAILPVTFSANFAFMHLLTRTRQKAVAGLAGGLDHG